MYHRLDDRIKAHVLVCWLALLLIRVVEVKTNQPWSQVRAELDRMHSVTLEGPSGRVAQRTETTSGRKKIFADLGVAAPPRFRRISAVETSA